MTRAVLTSLLAFCSVTSGFAQMGNMSAPTYAKDVAPILRNIVRIAIGRVKQALFHPDL